MRALSVVSNSTARRLYIFWVPQTSEWSQLTEELVPIEISQLFFFDGEKIRALAEDATSSETLGTAIRALLGLDIVERLIADTSVLQDAPSDLLTAVAEQGAQERVSAEGAFVRNLLTERDETLLATLAKHTEFTRGRLAILTNVLAEDREKRAPGQAVKTRLSLHDPARSHLSHLRAARLGELQAEAGRLIERLQQAATEREELERLLSAVVPHL